MNKEQIEEKAIEFFQANYPLLEMPKDIDEIDYYQMIEFIEWLIKGKFLPCKHLWIRTTKNYKRAKKCYNCGKIKYKTK